MSSLYVVKRSGKREEVRFDKITERIKKLTYGLDKRYIDPVSGGRDDCTSARVCTRAAAAPRVRAERPSACDCTARMASSLPCTMRLDARFPRRMVHALTIGAALPSRRPPSP